MEDVAVREDALRTVRFLPCRIHQVVHVVAVLQVHRQALKTIGNFTRDRLAFETAHLLEIGELRHFHPVHPDFPAEAPGAERRILPVVFDEADIVDFRIDPQCTQRAQIKVDDVRRSRLQNHLILMVLLQTIGIFAVTAVLRTTRGLNISSAPGFGTKSPQERRGVGGAGADFQVDRLQQRAALPIPVFLQAQDHFLKSNHRFVRAALCGRRQI